MFFPIEMNGGDKFYVKLFGLFMKYIYIIDVVS